MKPVRLIYAAIYLLALYAPIAIVVIFSFNDSIYPAFPLRGFTLQWYETALANKELWRALRNSLLIATTTAVVSTAIGLLAALAVSRYQFHFRKTITLMLYAPLALPTVVAGVALLSLFLLVGVRLSLATVAIGHVLVCTPFAFGVLSSRLEGLNPDFEHASMDLGEGPFFTFWRVTLPLALPGILSSLMLTFTISFDEFILSFFLSSNSPTLPVFMWSQMRFPDRLPMVLALATAVLALSVLLIVLSLAIQGRNKNPIPGVQQRHG
jgi:spermidine/putrescine transport system permease protein